MSEKVLKFVKAKLFGKKEKKVKDDLRTIRMNEVTVSPRGSRIPYEYEDVGRNRTSAYHTNTRRSYRRPVVKSVAMGENLDDAASDSDDEYTPPARRRSRGGRSQFMASSTKREARPPAPTFISPSSTRTRSSRSRSRSTYMHDDTIEQSFERMSLARNLEDKEDVEATLLELYHQLKRKDLEMERRDFLLKQNEKAMREMKRQCDLLQDRHVKDKYAKKFLKDENRALLSALARPAQISPYFPPAEGPKYNINTTGMDYPTGSFAFPSSRAGFPPQTPAFPAYANVQNPLNSTSFAPGPSNFKPTEELHSQLNPFGLPKTGMEFQGLEGSNKTTEIPFTFPKGNPLTAGAAEGMVNEAQFPSAPNRPLAESDVESVKQFQRQDDFTLQDTYNTEDSFEQPRDAAENIKDDLNLSEVKIPTKDDDGYQTEESKV
ncbi:unnamed protein product [Bursaphelenchus xylophilus]|uniref:(pine wood nematode) hypothetical protein n=1 Tax=Bursaphelenchus xylophilus TaxID=6326 RepID=A0A1I7SV78_BURXY|nr:unnamed protein product [Bursaphelenchus xylophilus]CAG9101025.1 unnamed protein product [Bursaphelenchus xylophilus]